MSARRRIATGTVLSLACACLVTLQAGTFAPPWSWTTPVPAFQSGLEQHHRDPWTHRSARASPKGMWVEWFTFPGYELSPFMDQPGDVEKARQWREKSHELRAAHELATQQLSAKALSLRALPGGGWIATCDWWIIRSALAVLLVPCIWFTYRTLKRRRPGHCPKCNYDRTGLAAGAVCPECGSKGGPS